MARFCSTNNVNTRREENPQADLAMFYDVNVMQV